MTNFFLGFVFWWAVVDGDTIKVHVHTWPNHAATDERVRLARIDAPEVHAKQDCEKALAAKATEWTRGKLTAAKRIEIHAGVDQTPPASRRATASGGSWARSSSTG
jgi:endonuclease YncB( thermonuclease family)